MSKYKMWVFAIIVFLLVGFGVGYMLYMPPHPLSQSTAMSTYFQYSESELKKLKELSTESKLSVNELEKWDEILFDTVKKNELADGYAARIFAYVYAAQHDAAFLSYQVKGQWLGSFDAITKQTLCLFFEKDCNQFPENQDVYSNYLAKIIIEKLQNRITEDQAGRHAYTALQGDQYWAGIVPYYGQDFGSWKPWLIQSGNQFRAPTPPEPSDTAFWNAQLAETKSDLAHATDQQKEAVVFWAGGPGTVTPPGQWLLIANAYLWKENISLQQALIIRAILAMGMMDSIISVFDSKYSFWRKRPFMLDPSIVTIMPTPDHPSYPAGHSAISGAAYVILSHYFPSQKEHWLALAEEAGNSRLWGGIHLPIDNKEGMKLGMKVGEMAIQKQNF